MFRFHKPYIKFTQIRRMFQNLWASREASTPTIKYTVGLEICVDNADKIEDGL